MLGFIALGMMGLFVMYWMLMAAVSPQPSRGFNGTEVTRSRYTTQPADWLTRTTTTRSKGSKFTFEPDYSYEEITEGEITTDALQPNWEGGQNEPTLPSLHGPTTGKKRRSRPSLPRPQNSSSNDRPWPGGG